MNRAALSASLEDYLESIARIEESGRVVRSKDIAADLGIRTASVTGALRALQEKGCIEYEPYGSITLTPGGRRAGVELLRSHEVLRDFLVTVLKVGAEEANKVACGMEHSIPPGVMRRFVRFFHTIRDCPLVAGAAPGEQGAGVPEPAAVPDCRACQKAQRSGAP
jgi:DtxR family Mn-dependent transcriptional regulator